MNDASSYSEGEMRELAILSEIGKVVRSALDLDERLQAIVEATVSLMKIDACSIYLGDEVADDLVLEASAGLDEGTFADNKTQGSKVPLKEALGPIRIGLGEGITGRSAQERKPIVVRDLVEWGKGTDPFPKAGEGGFNSQLAVPLVDEGNLLGMLNVYTVERRGYSQRDIALLSTIADQVAPAIRNSQLHNTIKQRLAELSTLYDIGMAINSTRDLGVLLNLIAFESARVIKARGSVLRLLDEEGLLRIRAYHGVDLKIAEESTLELGEGIAGWVAEKGQPALINDVRSNPRFADATKSVISCLICVPLLVEGKVIGSLAVYDKTSFSGISLEGFTEGDLQLLSTFASQAVQAIENARLFAFTTKRADDMKNLQTTAQELLRPTSLEEKLLLIMQRVKEFSFDRGWLALIDEEENVLAGKAGFGEGVTPEVIYDKTPLGLEGNPSEIAIREKRPVLVNDPLNDLRLSESIRELFRATGTKSFVTIPIIAGDKVIGIISVAFDRDKAITSEDMQLLSTFAYQAGLAIENARLYERAERLARANEIKVKKLSMLQEVSKAMQGTLQLKELLYIILTAVTLGDGMGFNRAVLLLVDEKNGVLEGRMGLGPSSPEDAGRIWSEIASQKGSLADLIIATGKIEELDNKPFNQIAKSIRIPIKSEAGILAKTVLERSPFNVKDANSDPNDGKEIADILGCASFASVPLIAKDRVVGVMVVDNLYNQQPITDEDIHFLMTFANQVGLAIERAEMYDSLATAHTKLKEAQEQLIKSVKLAAIGEVTETVAHDIRNPLVCIGGYARRLQRKLEKGSPIRRYSRVIIQEVEELERVLKDVLNFVERPELTQRYVEFKDIANGLLSLVDNIAIDKKVDIVVNIADDLPPLFVDVDQLKGAFLNIIYNAFEAMPEGGRLEIKADRCDYGMEIRLINTGEPIPRDIQYQIFAPFFTTKVRGTGLGLAVTRRIIREHKGIIELESTEGETTFIIKLPGANGSDPE